MELLIFVCWFVSCDFTKLVLTNLGVASSAFSMCKIILFANRECWTDFFPVWIPFGSFSQYHSEQMSWERASVAYSRSLKSFLFLSAWRYLWFILTCMSSRHFIFLEFLSWGVELCQLLLLPLVFVLY